MLLKNTILVANLVAIFWTNDGGVLLVTKLIISPRVKWKQLKQLHCFDLTPLSIFLPLSHLVAIIWTNGGGVLLATNLDISPRVKWKQLKQLRCFDLSPPDHSVMTMQLEPPAAAPVLRVLDSHFTWALTRQTAQWRKIFLMKSNQCHSGRLTLNGI